jgi:hypothetical protein
MIQHIHVVGHVLGERHLVRHHNHRHAIECESRFCRCSDFMMAMANDTVRVVDRCAQALREAWSWPESCRDAANAISHQSAALTAGC